MLYIVGIVLAFVLTYFSIPVLIRNAPMLGLIDRPSGRKKHLKATPVVGGISMSIAFFVAAIVGRLLWDKHYTAVFFALFILLITGIIDDRKGLSAAMKWAGQAGAAMILIFKGYALSSFHNVLGIPDLPYWVMVVLSLVFITALVNAVNLLDGIDGLVGGIMAINFTIFGVLFMLRNEPSDSFFAFALAAALMAFLIFNFAPASIFMGDAGSLFLGGALSYFFLQIWNNPHKTEEIYLAVALVSFPVFDMVRVFIYRLVQKRSPFSSDRSHFHHYLIKTGLHQALATLIMYVLNMLLILQSILLSRFGLEKFIIANLLFFLLLFYLVREHSLYRDGEVIS